MVSGYLSSLCRTFQAVRLSSYEVGLLASERPRSRRGAMLALEALARNVLVL
jgi:hypothetical protein